MSKITLLKNTTILDVVSGELIEGMDIVIKGDRIVDVTKKVNTQKADQIINLNGNITLPGLCDAHVHVIASTPNFAEIERWSPVFTTARAMRILKNMLMRGFTTVRDAGGADFGLARAIDEGYATGPRLLFCGKALSQTGGHGDMRSPGENFESCLCCAGLGRVCDGVSEVRKACRDEIRKGATHIKIMASGGVASPTDRISSSQFSLDEISAAVEEANNANIYVLAHAYLPKSISRALECGVRSIEHGNMIDSQTSAILIEKNAFLVPTMSTHEILPIEGLKAGMPAEMLEKVAAVTEAGKINFPNAWKQGVRMVFGTDLLGTMHEHQLLEFALRGEFQKPIDVIRSATNVAADLFQMSDNIGQIKPGAFADIISVSGNPLEDLGILQKPTKFLKLIIKGGKIYKNEY